MFLMSLYRNLQLVWACRRESLRDLWKVLRLTWIYNKLDGHLARFRKQSGIKCFRGCGQCCENPYVETTVLEMLPLAAKLFHQKQIDAWLDDDSLLEITKGKCPFYRADPHITGNGSCGVSSFRPLICRLYGYSAKHDKNGSRIYYTCKRIKSAYVESCENICSRSEKISTPHVEDYAMMRLEIAREIDRNLYPLPVALKLAIERVGFSHQMRKNL